MDLTHKYELKSKKKNVPKDQTNSLKLDSNQIKKPKLSKPELHEIDDNLGGT